jgi:hypothetical protein
LALCLASRNHLTVFAEHDPWGVDVHPTPPTRVPLTTPPFCQRGGPRHEIGAKTRRAQSGGLFDKGLCAAPCAQCSSGLHRRRQLTAALMAETRLIRSPRFL